MRGKEQRKHIVGTSQGITPAHAGKRTLTLPGFKWHEDHPRACGEKTMVRPTGRPYRGSPPRMRGKGPLVSAMRVGTGITPAHAGKRLKRSRITDCFRCVPLHFRLVSHKLSASNGSRAPPGALPCLPAQNAAPVQAVYNWTGPVFFAVQEEGDRFSGWPKPVSCSECRPYAEIPHQIAGNGVSSRTSAENSSLGCPSRTRTAPYSTIASVAACSPVVSRSITV